MGTAPSSPQSRVNNENSHKVARYTNTPQQVLGGEGGLLFHEKIIQQKSSEIGCASNRIQAFPASPPDFDLLKVKFQVSLDI